MSVLVETTLGDLTLDLFVEERPTTCRNFLKLCKLKYYNLCQIFIIEPNYIAQMGDPTNTGRGGESVFGMVYGQTAYFQEEKLHHPRLNHTRAGLLSMVNNGQDEFGSQFFITLGDELDFLDRSKHCVFGQVGEGMDTVRKINEELVDEQHHPFRDIRIAHTIVLYDPFDDFRGLRFPSRSPSPTIDLIKVENKIALCDNVDEDEGKSAEQVREELEQKEMRAQAQILEMVGDLHYADETAPDNVLFVCKLNPVTTDEDLEVIFSRFGAIKCCEVIKDRRTGASLQYAFIEFEKPEYCEAAFLKMDNVLIDDRRIHVDFSQSVAKNFQWHRSGGGQGPPTGPPPGPLPSVSQEKSRRRRSRSREREDKGRDSHHRREHRPSPPSQQKRRGEEEEKGRRRDDDASAKKKHHKKDRSPRGRHRHRSSRSRTPSPSAHKVYRRGH